MSAQELPTIESILEFMRLSAKESAEFRRKSDEEAAAFRRKSDEEAAAFRRKTDEELARLRAETELAEKAEKASRERMEASIKEAGEIVGRLGNRVGDVIEQLVIPKINEKFEPFGFNFVTVAPNFTWKIKGKVAAEVDVFLTNGDAVMAIEVKTHLTTGDVKYHLQRLEKLRARAAEFGLTEKKIYGAVTAPVIDPDARELALHSGLFVIEQPDEKDLKIIAPSGEFAPRAW
jgi:hypothetical protein